MKLDELAKKGLIAKQTRDPAKVKGSLVVARHFLDMAKRNKELGLPDAVLLLAYNAMFHAARALLFQKGYKERSHLAMIEALRYLYREDKELQNYLKILDSYRRTRHLVQYGTEPPVDLNAAQAIKDAESLIGFVVSLLKINGK